jgi:hypothetical protein
VPKQQRQDLERVAAWRDLEWVHQHQLVRWVAQAVLAEAPPLASVLPQVLVLERVPSSAHSVCAGRMLHREHQQEWPAPV